MKGKGKREGYGCEESLQKANFSIKEEYFSNIKQWILFLFHSFFAVALLHKSFDYFQLLSF